MDYKNLSFRAINIKSGDVLFFTIGEQLALYWKDKDYKFSIFTGICLQDNNRTKIFDHDIIVAANKLKYRIYQRNSGEWGLWDIKNNMSISSLERILQIDGKDVKKIGNTIQIND